MIVISVCFIGVKDARGNIFTQFSHYVGDNLPLSWISDEPNSYFFVNDQYIFSFSALPSYTPEPPIRINGASAIPTTKRVFLPGDDIPRIAGQCVLWIKYYAGVDFSGNAKEWVKYANSDKPEIGEIIILDLGKLGHLGIIISINDGVITYRSRNRIALWIVSDDTISIEDPRILGYISIK